LLRKQWLEQYEDVDHPREEGPEMHNEVKLDKVGAVVRTIAFCGLIVLLARCND